MIFARFFYLVQVLVFQNKCLFNFDFEILNLANNFCAAEEVLWLLSLHKFFCLSVTFLWYRSYVSIRLLRKSYSHFFWQRIREEFKRSHDSSVQKQRKFALFLLRNGNSRELLIRGAQLGFIVVLFKVPDAPPCSNWCGNMTSRRFNDHPGFEMLELTKPYGGAFVSSLPGNIYFIRACPRSTQPYFFRDRFNEKKISRLFRDCIGQSGCAAIPDW